MRILGIASFTHTGGAQVALQRLARRLRERGHEVEVVFLYGDPAEAEPDIKARVMVHTTRPTAVDYAVAFFRLIQEIRALRPEAVVGFLPLAAVLSALAAALCGVRVRIASQRTPGPTFSATMQFFDRVAGTLGVYTKIVCVSQAVADSFWNYPLAYRNRLRVVNNGIEWVDVGGDRRKARAAFGLTDEDVAFVAVGRLEPQKNYAFLIRRFCAVGKGKLYIAGDGRDEPELRALIQAESCAGRVVLLGYLDKPALRELLTAADVFVQASFYEGQSNALLEAMHAGLPCLASNISMQRETVVDEGGVACAKLADLQDETAWDAAIEDLAANRAERERLGAAGKALVNRRFTLQQMVENFEREIAESIGA